MLLSLIKIRHNHMSRERDCHKKIPSDSGNYFKPAKNVKWHVLSNTRVAFLSYVSRKS